jgi:uncharacterized protein involved in exopolysaccharide biosynthesis
MALPKQVQAQLDEVEALEKTLSARKKDPEKAEKPEKGTEKPETEGEKPKEDAEKAAKPREVKPAEPKPEVVPEDFEQRYRTLRGKYDAEVPRLHQEVNTLRAEIAELTKKVSTPAPKEPEATRSYCP